MVSEMIGESDTFLVGAFGEGVENVVVVHCKAGMARTGVMICSLLLFLKFFPMAEEAMNYYNHIRCMDGKTLVLPSQIRYVKYFEHILKHFNGETPPDRRYTSDTLLQNVSV
ncbi:dual-specificity protein phosphatase PTEN-like [Pyrus ussuriensis x Pyrus communis]|uniref:Dual-specificity protein phosphatase PTEN-like n=1 Tax=Pyrus ussuriensis x Pyrus communis TaxID=2448454 RepID=A0A5N5F3K6_9ROSA|nr:dual-specificity protein phosphatase PTEN-like [Pyrus ussuriensis x Pyrus communis]